VEDYQIALRCDNFDLAGECDSATSGQVVFCGIVFGTYVSSNFAESERTSTIKGTKVHEGLQLPG